MPLDITAYLAARRYPGRGILLGLAPDGYSAFVAYFLMGRSANSRNRVLAETDDGLLARPADPGAVEDPTLILYAPVWRQGEVTVVANGDQTDTVRAYLERGDSFEAALRSHTYEPDAPHHTPRITGLLRLGMGGFGYRLSVIRRTAEGQAAHCFYEYHTPVKGVGHLVHTYDEAQGEGILPAFCGEPVAVALPKTLDALGDTLWNALDAENRVALFVRRVTLEAQEDTRIYNRYEAK